MRRVSVATMAVFLVLCIVGNASAALRWASNGLTCPWNSDETWGWNSYPVDGDTAYINLHTHVVIDATSEACDELHLGSWSGESDVVILDLINGSSFTVGAVSGSGTFYVGVANGQEPNLCDFGELNIETDCTLTIAGHLNIGFNGDGTLNMTGGTITVGDGVGEQEWLTLPNVWQTNGSGQINLDGGLITTANFIMDDRGGMDITQGKLRLQGDQVAITQGYVDSGWITAYAGSGIVSIIQISGYTEVTGIPEWRATNPDPCDGATGVAVDATLHWDTGTGSPPNPIAYHHVYLGTDAGVVFTATPSDTDIYRGELDVATEEFSLAGQGVTTDGTYYWRIDEKIDADNIGHGELWSFETVKMLPIFSVQPVGHVGEAGWAALFSVVASNADSFQWFKYVDGSNDTPINDGGRYSVVSDASSSTLTISNTVTADEGDYYCKATKTGVGSTNSDLAFLVIKRLVGHWTFDEGGGSTAYDSSGLGNDCDVDGATWEPSGIINGSLDFNGVGDVVTNGSDNMPGIPVGNHPYTICAWIKPRTFASEYPGIVAYGEGLWDELDNRATALTTYDRTLSHIWWNNNLNQFGTQEYLTADTWTFVIAGWDSFTRTIWVNGTRVLWDWPGTHLIETTKDFAIGRYKHYWNDPGEFFDGLIDDVRIYNYYLSSVEIAVLYTDVAGGSICVEIPDGDFNGDCRVDIKDLAIFASYWLNCNLVPDCLP